MKRILALVLTLLAFAVIIGHHQEAHAATPNSTTTKTVAPDTTCGVTCDPGGGTHCNFDVWVPYTGPTGGATTLCGYNNWRVAYVSTSGFVGPSCAPNAHAYGDAYFDPAGGIIWTQCGDLHSAQVNGGAYSQFKAHVYGWGTSIHYWGTVYT